MLWQRPFGPQYINSVLAGDSSSGFRRGISHFLMATRNTTEGVGEKEQRTNEQ